MRLTIAIALAAALLLCGCQREPENILTSFERDYFDELFRFRPTLASIEGLHQFDGRMDDLNPVIVGRRIAELQHSLNRLFTLRAQEMPPSEQIDATLIEYALRAELTDLSEIGTWRRTPALYPELPISILHHFMNGTYTVASERLKAAIISIHETDAVMATMRTNITSASPADAKNGIHSAERLIDLFDNELPAWGQQAAGVDMRAANNFRAALEITKGTLANSSKWLREELLPAADRRPGLGPKGLVMQFLFEAMIDVPLAELHQRAQAALEADTQAFQEAAQAVAPNRPPAEALRNAGLQSVDAASIADLANQSAGKIRQFLTQKDLLAIPEDYALRLLPAPAYLRVASTRAIAVLPPLIAPAEKNGTVYLVTPSPRWSPELIAEFNHRLTSQEMELILINRALPGDYLHSLYAMKYPSRAGRFFGREINLRGWASYAEQMMVEEGYGGEDPLIRIVQLHRALIEDCRWLAAIEIHSNYMSVEEAAQVFREKALLQPALALVEAEEVASKPSKAYAAIGKHMILKLREDYRRAKGPEFTLRAFHEDFLNQGLMPITMVRKVLLPENPGPLL